jgi:hypothetical protein
MRPVLPYLEVKVEKYFDKNPENEPFTPDSMKKQAIVEVLDGELKGRYIAPKAKIITKDGTTLIHEDDLAVRLQDLP